MNKQLSKMSIVDIKGEEFYPLQVGSFLDDRQLVWSWNRFTLASQAYGRQPHYHLQKYLLNAKGFS